MRMTKSLVFVLLMTAILASMIFGVLRAPDPAFIATMLSLWVISVCVFGVSVTRVKNPDYVYVVPISKQEQSRRSLGFRLRGRLQRERKSVIAGAVDPSVIHRVIRDPISGEEVLVHGKETTTFRDAVNAHWDFTQVSKREQWTIVDDRGNDITDQALSEFSGVATIVYDMATSEEVSHEKEPASTMERGVEFYD